MSLRDRRTPGPTPERPSVAFTPSQYDADLTMNGTAQSVAIATGAEILRINNRGGTGEHIRIAFGTSAAAAEANLTIANSPPNATTGHFIAANSNGNGTILEDVGIPLHATHYAVANAVASDVQVVSITQGR